MDSMERTLAVLNGNIPDRIPLFFLLATYGAKFKRISIKNYFTDPKLVAKTQLEMLKFFNHDCLTAFYYASAELEAFGGSTIFFNDGPPNAGPPIKVNGYKITKTLTNILTTIKILKSEVGNTVPIIGVVISPYSLPIMQLGFENYLEIDPLEFNRIMEINKKFAIEWANLQLEAGATAICYFDPALSPTIMYNPVGIQIAKEVTSKINGPTAIHFASGRCLSILNEIKTIGTNIIGISAEENLEDFHDITTLGNLDGITMRNWNKTIIEEKVKITIEKGGNFILADNHGEIPFQVPKEVLLGIRKASIKFGTKW